MSQAQLLQCPDCGYRHDLGSLGDVFMFRCEQCGRALKVPAQFRDANAAAAAPSPARPRMPVADPTLRQPAVSASGPAPTPRPVDEPGFVAPPAGLDAPLDADDEALATARPPRRPRRDGAKPHVPVLWRLLVWVLAIPIGLVVVFQLIARKLGWLTQNELIDAFTAGGWDRFRPIAQLLPLAAFVIALLVQGGVFGIECMYRRKIRKVAVGALRTDPERDQPVVRATGS